MLMKSIAAGLAGTALLATVAFAQQSPTATTDKAPTAATTTTTSASDQWRASKMSGLKIYNEANENIGSINDLLMDKSGNIKIAVIGVGGFLGMGEHLVAVPFDKLKFVNEAVAYTSTSATNPPGRPASTTTTGAATGTDKTATTTSSASKWYPDHAVFNASKDELKNMPEFKYSE
ncbi:PRC-barrel domain-containing protein [Bradyrhizobium liaoningense]|uniref:PRC-barrel domain-containing protein n=1 Tax=Bradyrhizobium liaoningense TaxID=43992 RepID=UPI001BA7DBE6|nr:PRC-barrel domain-containing protein [Bradyrhizobium liaoningense]MBR0842407.1 PRC-barrel domain-containing protein [Bradyrhizobium liaoningense]MBR0855166.1 PRC-barrel domain-containing protein [Bradyrhizobium liaoningense]